MVCTNLCCSDLARRCPGKHLFNQDDTEDVPHHLDLMRTIAFWPFCAHFMSITAQTAVLIEHLAKKELARGVLMQTTRKRVVNVGAEFIRHVTNEFGSYVAIS